MNKSKSLTNNKIKLNLKSGNKKKLVSRTKSTALLKNSNLTVNNLCQNNSLINNTNSIDGKNGTNSTNDTNGTNGTNGTNKINSLDSFIKYLLDFNKQEQITRKKLRTDMSPKKYWASFK